MAKTNKIPSDYFSYPELLAFILFPISFGLLPIAGFQPQLLQGIFPPAAYAFVLKYQVSMKNFCLIKI